MIGRNERIAKIVGVKMVWLSAVCVVFPFLINGSYLTFEQIHGQIAFVIANFSFRTPRFSSPYKKEIICAFFRSQTSSRMKRCFAVVVACIYFFLIKRV